MAHLTLRGRLGHLWWRVRTWPWHRQWQARRLKDCEEAILRMMQDRERQSHSYLILARELSRVSKACARKARLVKELRRQVRALESALMAALERGTGP